MISLHELNDLLRDHGPDYVSDLFYGGPEAQQAAGVDLGDWRLEHRPPFTMIYRVVGTDDLLDLFVRRSALRVQRRILLRAERDIVTQAELRYVLAQLRTLDDQITAARAEADGGGPVAGILSFLQTPDARDSLAEELARIHGPDVQHTLIFEIRPGQPVETLEGPGEL